MERNHETWPLVSVFHYRNDINPTPEYQRYAVWSRSQQQLLMDSIYRGLDIPKLYLRAMPTGSKFKYEAVDGQQRLRAVWEFFENEYALSEKLAPEVAGKKYEDLDIEERKRFELYQFNLVIIKQAADAEIREMFCRLQNGMPLNSAERRNAMVGGMRDFCAALAEHPFFGSVRFQNKRMQYQQVAAQTVMLELNGKPVDTKKTALVRLYQEHATFNPAGEKAKRIRKVYDFLAKCFPERTPELKRGYAVSFYFLVSQLMAEYVLAGHEEEVGAFLMHFDHRRRTEKDNVELIKFNEKLSHSSDSPDSIGFRHEVLLREFLSFCPELIPIDPKRGFDDAQRTTIFRRDGGKCRFCGSKVKWEDFEADHVVPHVAGGPTTVDNGWLACSTCNKKKGSKPHSKA